METARSLTLTRSLELAGAEQARRYFDAEAERFDAIYRSDKGLTQRVVDRLFRTVIHRRFALTLELCGDVKGKRVLDVGCGSGRYAIELARRGAEVVGLDFAPAMVEMSTQRASEAGLSDRCTFEVAEFLEWCEPHHFDICLGIGFFDYIAEPQRFLAKMRQITEGQGVFSFPVRWTVRSLTSMPYRGPSTFTKGSTTRPSRQGRRRSPSIPITLPTPRSWP